ncbi:MAG: SAM-dependent methyltransferase [Verrucomicrobiota bacterium]
MTRETEIEAGGSRLRVWEEDEPEGRDRALFWPCSGEYPIYDSFLYGIMVDDGPRNRLYEAAIAAACPGRTVVEIGTGAAALWALACARAGAERVYAIESDARAAEKARGCVAESGFGEVIEIVDGLSTAIDLPGRVDLCVSEIIGEIGGAEGAAVVLNDARRRHLKAGGLMIPALCRTWGAGVCLPDELMVCPRFQSDGVPYLKAIFDHVGRPFDVRVAVENHLGKIDRLTGRGEFECLDFGAGLVEQGGERRLELEVERGGRLDGLALWIELSCEAGGEVLDVWGYLSNWIPVYFPLFYPGLAVEAGERIRVEMGTVLSDDGVHPDYCLTGEVCGADGEAREAFRLESPHHGTVFRGHPFYEKLMEVVSG